MHTCVSFVKKTCPWASATTPQRMRALSERFHLKKQQIAIVEGSPLDIQLMKN